ncbi:MAG: hypothetical protein U0R19_18860 [Bryobacteraceae bacterium]
MNTRTAAHCHLPFSVLAIFTALPPMHALAQQDAGCHQQQFGNFSEWSAPVNLGPALNSTSNDQWPAISPNGLSLYFASNRPGGSGQQDIWVTQRATLTSPWRTPQNLGRNINSESRDNAPTFSADGHWLIFSSSRTAGKCRQDSTNDLYISYRRNAADDFGWEPAVNFGCELSAANENAGPAFFEDRESGITTLYFTSARPGGPGGFDTYSSTRGFNGPFANPVLVPELTTPLFEGGFAIRGDGLEMFLCWNAPAGLFTDCDLSVSTRAATSDVWSVPVNLGPSINTSADDGFPSLSCDGTTLYFASNRPGGSGGEDLYVTTRIKFEEPAIPAQRR